MVGFPIDRRSLLLGPPNGFATRHAAAELPEQFVEIPHDLCHIHLIFGERIHPEWRRETGTGRRTNSSSSNNEKGKERKDFSAGWMVRDVCMVYMQYVCVQCQDEERKKEEEEEEEIEVMKWVSATCHTVEEWALCTCLLLGFSSLCPFISQAFSHSVLLVL